MDTTRPLTPDAVRRLTARRRRRGAIRRGIVVAGLSAFALSWGVIARTGSMGSTSAASSGVSSVVSASADPSVASDYGDDASDSEESGSEGSSSDDIDVSPVTTQTS
jgi:hypothetical protein